MRTRQQGAKILIALAAALPLLGAACSKSSSPPTTRTQPPATTQPPASASPSAAGAMLQQGAGGFVFSPTTLSVKEGESITVASRPRAADLMFLRRTLGRPPDPFRRLLGPSIHSHSREHRRH